jgi:hypothetical protein
VNHYEVLGVSPAATTAELRAAYLALVRLHHPDRHVDATPAQQEAAEDRMRRVNEAWSELSDPDRRRRYDLQLDRRPRATVVGQEGPSTWQPIDDEPDDFVDERLDDTHRPPPRGGRLLAMTPPTVLAIGVVLTVFGIVVRVREVLAFGVMGVILGAGLFVVVPLSIILESRQNDLR